ncbi:DUF982 domain-containing protein [Rhizobium deserti]|uniref:DUF982 domain-containing protein n=1 Tax=Rhizobium deserti TaxID=2547961 RepID=A0A4R5UFM2_9HYPH|nr:DUF982 domain-containing protein [Rhizobium deserti]
MIPMRLPLPQGQHGYTWSLNEQVRRDDPGRRIACMAALGEYHDRRPAHHRIRSRRCDALAFECLPVPAGKQHEAARAVCIEALAGLSSPARGWDVFKAACEEAGIWVDEH